MGEEGNEGQVVFYPAQFKATGPGTGQLRVFDQVTLRIYYDDGNIPSDFRAPVFGLVTSAPTADSIHIEVHVTDDVGVIEVTLLYTWDGVTWTSLSLPRIGTDLYGTDLAVPPGSNPSALSYIVQAVDGVGNVAFSANKGETFSGVDESIFLPLVLKNR